MESPYAELTLYYGLVDADGCGECRFDLNATDTWNRERIIFAMKTINGHLIPSCDWGFHFVSSDYPIRSKEDGEFLCQFAESNIHGARAIIEPIDCAHGTIAFYRKINFGGWIKEEEQKLIEKLKKSGYIPVYKHKEHLEKLAEPFEGKARERFQREIIDVLDSDKPWKDALKFY